MLYTDSRNDNGSYMKSLAEECYQGAFQFDALLCGVQIHGGRNFHRKSLSKQVKVRPHVSFVVLLKGELTFTIDHKVYRFEAQESGRLIMISLKEASVFGRLANAGNYCEKLVLRGMEYWLKERVSEPSLTHGLYQQVVRDWPLNESLRQLSEQWLTGEDNHKAWQGALYKDVLGMNLLNQAWQHFSTQSGGSLSALENRLASLVGQGVYSISQLADHLNMSERSLQRHSKEVLKQPLGKWINEQRLNKSKRLLEEQSSSLSEVAWQVGYKQVSSFIHAFQRQFGITPKAYVVQYRVNH